MRKEAETNKEIAFELVEMAQADQIMRQKAQVSVADWGKETDKANTERLRELVESNGWPTIDKVGKQASQAAWLLAQHADHDPAFQQQCLDLMKQAEPGQVAPANIAYLEDRVRVNNGQPQLYGTQFYKEGETFGPRPIEDKERVEERRAAVGLEPYSAYYEDMTKRYG
jgi:hypothetical protein